MTTNFQLPKTSSLDQLKDYVESNPSKVRVFTVCPSVAQSSSSELLPLVSNVQELNSYMKRCPQDTLVVLCSNPPQLAQEWIQNPELQNYSNLVALKANPQEWLQTLSNYDVPEWDVQSTWDQRTHCELIDVRGDDEYDGPLSHIQGSQLVTLGDDLVEHLQEKAQKPQDSTLVFVCRSGARSMRAALYARQLGIHDVINMKGGMIAWNEAKLPTAASQPAAASKSEGDKS